MISIQFNGLTGGNEDNYHRMNQIVAYLTKTVAPISATIEKDQGFVFAMSGSYLSKSWSLTLAEKSNSIDITVIPSYHEAYIALKFL